MAKRTISDKNLKDKAIIVVHNLLCVIDFFTKYDLVKCLKDKKAKIVLHVFVEIVNESNRKPNKLWVDQRRKFYNDQMQKWLVPYSNITPS